MARSRELLRSGSVVLSLILVSSSISGASSAGVATVVSAERASVGRANASVGSTVFNGDSLEVQSLGSMQLRAGAARVLLSGGSRVVWGEEGGMAAATLSSGVATFSTASSKAFTLRAGTAVIRPTGQGPSVGSVAVLNPKELNVHCSRGSLTLTVIDDSLVIPEGTSYHIVLDPEESAAADEAKPWGGNQAPRKSGRNRFLFFVIVAAAAATAVAVHEALESPDRP
jgi:hypothetical protein